MEEKKVKKKFNVRKLIAFIILLILIVSSGFLIYSFTLLGPIEPLIRNIASGVVIVIDLVFLIKFINKSKKKKKKVASFSVVGFILSLIYIIISLPINYVYGSLGNTNKEFINYISNLVVLEDSEVESIEDLSDMKIGILNNNDSPDGHIIPNEVIYEEKLNEENDIVEASDYQSLMASLYNEELDAIFITSTYVDLFKTTTGYENIETDTKVIGEWSKQLAKVTDENSVIANNDKSLDEPFTMLIMGIDSTTEGLDTSDSHNGDALILVTFNPKTLNATVLSIPRDTYVPIACFEGQKENKITHASWNGTECMIETIENFTDIEIDYYAKMNFKGLVGLVDAVGGIDVYVPTYMCTDNSGRGTEVCIDEGQQILNGEEALVLARNRKAFTDGDISRGLNQQVVIEGILNSVSNINSIDQIISILNTISNNMDTNFTENQILSFYNIFMDILANSSVEGGQAFSMQQLFLDGTGQTIYDESMGLPLWNYVLSEDGLNEVIEAMQMNLNIIEPSLIKEFSFAVNEEYEAPIIGEGPHDSYNTYALLPNLIGESKEDVQYWANRNGVRVSFVEKESIRTAGTVIAQSLPETKRLDLISGTLTITIAKNTVVEEPDEDPVTGSDSDKEEPSSDTNDKEE